MNTQLHLHQGRGLQAASASPGKYALKRTKARAPIPLANSSDCDHMNKDGTFKGGFDGCVLHMTTCEGHSEESARKICGKIAQTVGNCQLPIANRQLEIAIENATTLDDDGWALIGPFGEWPKTRQYLENGQVKREHYIQVLDNQAADAMVGKENSFFTRLKRAIVGIPIFEDHGDLKDHDPKAISNAPKKKIGVIDQIRKSERGIEAHFALDTDGAAAVAAGKKFPSALWMVMPFGTRALANGLQAILARPFKLISAGLTEFPNISGVESLANSGRLFPSQQTTTETNKDMSLKQNLIGLLIGRGIKLPADPSDQQIIAAIPNAKDDDAESNCPNCDALGKKAHLASSRANSPETHATAARAHQMAADAHQAAGNGDHQEMHEDMAKYHLRQAK